MCRSARFGLIRRRFINRRTVIVETPPRYSAASFNFNAPKGAVGDFISAEVYSRNSADSLDYYQLYLVQCGNRSERLLDGLKHHFSEDSGATCFAIHGLCASGY